MAFTPITVTATYLIGNGTPAAGSVSFVLSTAIQDSTSKQIHSRTQTTVTLNGNGSLSTVLTANDDTTTVPTGSSYLVTEAITGALPRSYSIIIPHNAAGGTIDLSALAPTTTTPNYASLLTTNNLSDVASVNTARTNLGMSVYSAVAYGVKTTNSAATNTTNLLALLATVNAAGGGTIELPAGTINFTNLTIPSSTNYIHIVGQGRNQAGPGATTYLNCTGTGSTTAISWQNSRGIGLGRVHVTWSDATFTGNLLDLTGSTDILLDNCCFRVSFGSAGVATNPAALLVLDQAINLLAVQSYFYGGQYNITGRASNTSFANCVTFFRSWTQGAAVCAVRNPGQSWGFLHHVCEPLSNNGAGFITHDANTGSQGLTVDDLWAGDDNNGVSGTWITLCASCTGTRIVGGRIGCGQLTTGVLVNGNTCTLEVSGVTWFVGGGSSKGIDFGTTTGHTFTSRVCGGWGVLNTALNLGGNQPSTTFVNATYDTGGAVTQVNISVSGAISATTVTAAGTVSGATGSFGSISPNLLTAFEADFENASVSGWNTNNHASLATTTAAALHGGRCLSVTSTAGITTELSINMLQGAGPAHGLVAASPSTQYYALANFLLPAAQPARTVNVDMYAYDNTGTQIGSNPFASSNNLGTKDSTSAWTQLTCNGISPANTAYVGLVVSWRDQYAITHVNITNNVATITTAIANDYTPGQTVVVAGCTHSQFNGTWTLTGASGSTFTFALTGANIDAADTSGNAKGNMTVGEVHYLDCVQISASNPNGVWSLPGNATMNITSSGVQSSSGVDLVLAANGAGTSVILEDGSGNEVLTVKNDVLTVIQPTLVLATSPTTFSRITWGTTPPTTGTWSQGDVMWNTAVVAGNTQPEFWRCTASGTPGTWSAGANHP